jgi:hypothetical protein
MDQLRHQASRGRECRRRGRSLKGDLVLARARLVRTGLSLILVALVAAGCSKLAAVGGGGAASRLPTAALDQAIAQGIGDPTTCVILADAVTGEVLYHYGEDFNCVRGLPACDRPGYLTARQALKLAATPGGRETSCNSIPDGSRTVGWAEGTTFHGKRRLIYSAVMEGQMALPGHEMAARLADTFATAGL